MSVTKAWDWSQNTSDYWLIPCAESAFLAEHWGENSANALLDLGCGLGRHSLYMARRGFRVTAADLSHQAVEQVAARARQEELPIDTVCCNMLTLPFDDGAFDCAMAVNVIYHTDAAGFRRTLEEVGRVLQPGGEFFVTLLSKATPLYSQAPTDRRLDAYTILRDESPMEHNVPHFYVDYADICHLFPGWRLLLPAKEWKEYGEAGKTEFLSTHWTLLLKKEGPEGG